MNGLYFIQHIWCNTDYTVAIFDNEPDFKFYLESISQEIEVNVGGVLSLGALELGRFKLYDILDFTKPVDEIMKVALAHLDDDKECGHKIKYTRLDLNEAVRL